MIAAPSDLLLDVVRLTNVLTYLLTYISDKIFIKIRSAILREDANRQTENGQTSGRTLCKT